MTWNTEFQSWLSPQNVPVSKVPAVGEDAPSISELRHDKTPTVLAFLRHCGCPFAEKTFLQLEKLAKAYPNVAFVAISHSDSPSTAKWLSSLDLSNAGGSNSQSSPAKNTRSRRPAPVTKLPNAITSSSTPLPPSFSLIADPELRFFGSYGLGISSLIHVLSPASLWSAVKLEREEGIWNQPTESGSRWQTANGFAVDASGKVSWSWVADRADAIGDFEKATASLKT